MKRSRTSWPSVDALLAGAGEVQRASLLAFRERPAVAPRTVRAPAVQVVKPELVRERAVLPVTLYVEGAPRTKKNSLRRRWSTDETGKRHLKSIPSEAFDAYEKIALPQLEAQWRGRAPVEQPVNLRCAFYIDADRVVDTVGLYQAIADILVDAKVLADDERRIVVSWDGSRVWVDRERPRVEVVIEGAGS